MSKARDLGNLLDTDGDVVSGSLDNVPTPSKTSIEALGIALPAANLTGTVAEARIPATALNSNTITKSTSEPAPNTNPSGGVGTTWLRTTTGEMYCCTDATAGANVWTNVGAGSGDVSPYTGMAATGGTVTTDGDYKVHSFNSSGTFQITILGSDAVVEYLVIAGGGGGGSNIGGGGGAGGYRTATGFSVSATTYSITIGAGGAGISPNTSQGNQGSNSIFSSITSTGGGGGGCDSGPYNDGTNGGSGGGGGGQGGTGGSASPAGQGYDGGDGANASTYASAGGGGAGGPGPDASGSSPAVDGADGLASSITGSSVTRAGGGGGSENGGSTPPGAGSGGAGGGGDGALHNGNSAFPADANTGSGGGGMRSGTSGTSGAGGSGVVIIRYKFQ